MEKVLITVTVSQYTFTYKGVEYIVTLVPLDNGFTDFYIHRKDYGPISLIFGVDLTQFGFEEESDVDRYVQSQLHEWVRSYERDLKKLETT